jgi:hypothetical protein
MDYLPAVSKNMKDKLILEFKNTTNASVKLKHLIFLERRKYVY